MRKLIAGVLILATVGLGSYWAARLASAPSVHADETWRYVHITGTTAVSLTGSYSILHSLVINNAGASAVITIFDLPGPGSGATNLCSGTPTANKVAIITLPASGALPGTLLYDVAFNNGICIQDATAASDLTVSVKP
jgi:hypothetical protein